MGGSDEAERHHNPVRPSQYDSRSAGTLRLAQRRSRLDPHRDQVAEWVRQGKDTRAIATKLGEIGVSVTHQAVGNYIKKMMAPTLAKVAKSAERKLATVAEAADTMIRWLGDIESGGPLEPGERDRFRLLMEGFDRVAKLRGLYPKEGVQVGVQVNMIPAEEFWRRLREKSDPPTR